MRDEAAWRLFSRGTGAGKYGPFFIQPGARNPPYRFGAMERIDRTSELSAEDQRAPSASVRAGNAQCVGSGVGVGLIAPLEKQWRLRLSPPERRLLCHHCRGGSSWRRRLENLTSSGNRGSPNVVSDTFEGLYVDPPACWWRRYRWESVLRCPPRRGSRPCTGASVRRCARSL